jgi:hypothetical protein
LPLLNSSGQLPSADFLAAMSAGAVTTLTVNVGVTSGGYPVAGYQDLALESLTVTANRNNAQRTTASLVLTVIPPTAPATNWFPVPTDISSPLAPNGNELVVSSGFTYADGTSETFQLGVFPIVTVVPNASSTGDIVDLSVTADDRSWSISRRGLLQAYTVPVDSHGNPTQTVDALILALLQQNTSGLPPIEYNIYPTAELPNPPYMAPDNSYDQGQDPWQAAMDLAASIGYELYPDQAGNIQSFPLPTPGATPNWTFSDQGGQLSIISVKRTLTADEVYNDYFVTTNNTNTTDSITIQWEQWDGNAASPTYVGGPFGDIPNFINSSVSTTAAAAQLEATLDLEASIGQVDTIVLESVLNAAVKIDDVVSVTCAKIGCVGVTFVVDGFTSTFAIGGTTQYNLRRIVSIDEADGALIPTPPT